MLKYSTKKGKASASSRQRSRNNKKEREQHLKVNSKDKQGEVNPYLYQPVSYRNINTNRQIERQSKRSAELNHLNLKQDQLLIPRKSERIKKIQQKDQNQQLDLEMIDQVQNKQEEKPIQSSQTGLSLRIRNSICIFETENYQKPESVIKFLARFYLNLHLSFQQIQQDLVALKSFSAEPSNVLRIENKKSKNIDI